MGDHMASGLQEESVTVRDESVMPIYKTSQKTQESSTLSDEEEALLIPYIQQIVCILDNKGKCRHLTANWQHVTGHSPYLSLGPQFLKYFHPNHRKRIISKLSSVHSNSTREISNARIKCQLRHAEGSWRWMELVVTASRQGSPAANKVESEYICTLTDITKSVDTERKLQRAKLKAEQAIRGREDFLANMSHELRTPLNAILGFTQMMEKQIHGRISNPKYKEYIGNIQESGNTLLSKINDLLAISNINDEDLALAEQDIDLESLLEDVIEHRSHKAFRKHVSVNVSLPKRRIVIRGDKIVLQQALSNLLGDAIKYSKARGKVKITTKRNKENGSLDVIFASTGEDIGQERIKLLRQLMAKKEMQTSVEDERMLGFVMANEFARIHGGTLTVSSQQGKGTTAILNLPAKRITFLAHSEPKEHLREKEAAL